MALDGSALTTLDAVKDELQITDASDDSYLERLIRVASDHISTLCDRRFEYEEGRVERVKCFGTTLVSVCKYPIKELTSVQYTDGLVVPSAEVHSADAGLIANTAGWRWITAFARGIEYTPLPVLPVG